MANINYDQLQEKLTPSVENDEVLILDSEDGDIVKRQSALQFKGPKGDKGEKGDPGEMSTQTYDPELGERQVAFKENNDSISFQENVIEPTTPGTIYWKEGVLNVVQGNGVVQQVGLEQYKEGQNNTGATIANGTIVYFTNSIGASGKIRIDKFIANRTIPFNMLIGVVTEPIINGESGLITYDGVVRGIDTSAFTEGDILYVSPTEAGEFTNVKPSFPNQIVPIAVVRSVGTNGSIEVRVPNSLQEADDIWYDGLKSVKDKLDELPTNASELSYNNTIAGVLNATNTQDAIDEMLSKYNSAIVLKGNWNASVGTFPSGANSGFSYIVNVAGTVDGVEFNVNDRLIAITDGASTTIYANNWIKADYTDQVLSVNSKTGGVILDADDIDDSATTNKWTTQAEIDKLNGIEAEAEVNTINSDPTGITGADAVTNVVSLTQAEYDAITPNASTFYIITT